MKILILGLSASGKTTLGKSLSKLFGVPVIEADDETRKLNNGVWPSDEKVIDRYFDVINEWVLKMENVIYITSWLEKEAIVKFFNNGFKIIELHGKFEKLLSRRMNRDDPSKLLIKRFKKNYSKYTKIISKPEVTKTTTTSIDVSDLTVEELLKKVREVL